MILQGDCLDVMRDMDSETIDLVFTSPPYNLGNFKKGSFYDGKGKGEFLKYADHNDEMPKDEYVEWQKNVIRECYRLLKNDGAIFYNHKPRIKDGVYDDRKNLIPFPLRQEIIWDRCCMVNFSGSFYAPSTERIYIIAKKEWKPQREFLGWGEVWRIPPDTDNRHPAPFPKKLAERVVISASKVGDTVLDPCAGSGTTLLAAEEHGRKGIGIELSPEYVKLIEQRLSTIQPRLIFA